MSKKRFNGEGNIRKRSNGMWECRVALGRDLETGKPIRKSFYGHSQKEVMDKLDDFKHGRITVSAVRSKAKPAETPAKKARSKGTKKEFPARNVKPHPRMTVEEWLSIWFTEYLLDIRPNTAELYKTICRLHIIPHIGHIVLSSLRTPEIQQMYTGFITNGLSPKYIKNIHGVLHRALEQARKLEYIKVNPSGNCSLPKVIEKEMRPLTRAEQLKLLKTIKGRPYEAFFITALFTGMRSGELLGLTWDNIDFEHGIIYIKQQLLQSRRKGQPARFGPLKNGKTRRIKPAPFVIDTLREHKIAEEKKKEYAGILWNPGEFDGLVFTREDGSHLSQPTVSKLFHTVQLEAGLEPHRLHDCRHTFAVNSIHAGDDIKTIQENMGHFSAAFTLDKYGHVTDDMRDESANRMQNFIQRL